MAFTNFGSSTSKEYLTKRWGFIDFSSLVLIFGFTMTNAALTQCDLPKAEVVSIFNNHYSIPRGFGPFFIKINRCVQCDKCTNFLMPNVTTLVKAVVQNSIDGKVFEYTLHNHVSCMCGPKTRRKPEHYQSTFKEVGVDHKPNEKNNPPHIVDCKKPQQRYLKIDDYHLLYFHGYKQCLPICTTNKTVTSQLNITRWDGRITKMQVTNDLKCSYPPQFMSNENNRSDTVFNIDSKKTFFALVLLALVLLIVTIIDMTFCCRKKGFCYTIRKCMQNEEVIQVVVAPPTPV